MQCVAMTATTSDTQHYLLAMTPEPMADWFPNFMRWVYSCPNTLASPFLG